MAEPISIIANQYPHIVTPLIEGALHKIDIIVFDWRWYPTVKGSTISRFNNAILAAAHRGVAVRCLVNSDEVVKRLIDNGCDAKKVHSKKLLHTKMLLIDEQKLVIGSHNYTQSAFALNHEASVLLEMPSIDNDFVRYFNALWGV